LLKGIVHPLEIIGAGVVIGIETNEKRHRRQGGLREPCSSNSGADRPRMMARVPIAVDVGDRPRPLGFLPSRRCSYQRRQKHRIYLWGTSGFSSRLSTVSPMTSLSSFARDHHGDFMVILGSREMLGRQPNKKDIDHLNDKTQARNRTTNIVNNLQRPYKRFPWVVFYLSLP
jgi:hypothetical protein